MILWGNAGGWGSKLEEGPCDAWGNSGWDAQPRDRIKKGHLFQGQMGKRKKVGTDV